MFQFINNSVYINEIMTRICAYGALLCIVISLCMYVGVFVCPEVREWVAELKSLREKTLQPSDATSS